MLTPEQKAEANRKLKDMNEEAAREEQLKAASSMDSFIQKKQPRT